MAFELTIDYPEYWILFIFQKKNMNIKWDYSNVDTILTIQLKKEWKNVSLKQGWLLIRQYKILCDPRLFGLKQNKTKNKKWQHIELPNIKFTTNICLYMHLQCNNIPFLNWRKNIPIYDVLVHFKYYFIKYNVYAIFRKNNCMCVFPYAKVTLKCDSIWV